jgi:hypothetical protein
MNWLDFFFELRPYNERRKINPKKEQKMENMQIEGLENLVDQNIVFKLDVRGERKEVEGEIIAAFAKLDANHVPQVYALVNCFHEDDEDDLGLQTVLLDSSVSLVE